MPIRLPAESTTTPVVSLSVPTIVPSESTTLPVVASSTPRMLPAESTTTLPSTGSLAAAVAPSTRSPLSVPAISKPLSAPAGALPPTVVSLWSMVLSWMPVAIASASTV